MVYRSDKIIIFLFVLLRKLVHKMVQLNLIPQEPSQPRKTLQELGALRRLVSHKLNLVAVVLVMNGQPLGQRCGLVVVLLDFLQDRTGLFVLV